jgi:hypothetical protein
MNTHYSTFSSQEAVYLSILYLKIDLTALPTGITATLANHGAPQTLTTIRNGISAFTIAHAVAVSTTNLTPLLSSFIKAFLSPSPASNSTSPSPEIHPFRLKYRPNFSIPSPTHFPSANHDGSQFM